MYFKLEDLQMKKFYLLVTSFLLVLGFSASAMAAALPAGTLLTIDSGFGGASSYFTMVTSTSGTRSEERRVGKESRSRWSPYH